MTVVVRAGNCGAGALFTNRPSFSILRWSRGGGAGLTGVVTNGGSELGGLPVAGAVAVSGANTTGCWSAALPFRLGCKRKLIF